ncbi:MAG TPA: AAA family ATPase, partial [Vicinamibacteria bacterium]
MLSKQLADALEGCGSLVLVGGEAGIGKTALAEALCREAAERGALALVGRCYDLSETPPYGPWLELFAGYPSGGNLPPLPPVFAARGVPGEVTSQGALFRQVHEFLAALVAQRPAVVLLDDLHWADPASLDLLRYLARYVATLRLLLLVTYRADELTRRHPLSQLLPLLVREAHAERLDLRPLAGDDIRALVGRRYHLPEPDEARLVGYLEQHAEGNPFYAGELLRTLEEERLLRPAPGGWQLGDLRSVPVPALLRQVIDGRLARLGEDAQRLLAIAAVIGQEVPLALWGAVGGVEEEALGDAIERAVEAHVLEETPDGLRARFVHALIREALYEGVLPSRRRTWHRRVAEALLAAPGPDPDAVAYHLRQAGDPRAAEWLIRAGGRAERAYAWLTAAERYEAALTLLEGDEARAGERAVILLRLAQLRRYADPRQGVAYLEEAERLAAEAGDAALAAAALFDQGHLRCLADDYSVGLAQLAAALPALEALPAAARARLPTPAILGVPPAERDRYHRGVLVAQLAHAGRFAEARAASEWPGRRAPGRTSRELGGLAGMYAALGESERARQAFAAATEAQRAAGQHHEVGTMLWVELEAVVLPYLADQPAERRRLAAEAEAAWARGSGAQLGPPRALALPVLYLEGGWAEARQLALAALETARGGWRLFSTSYLGPLARAQGDAALAWRCIHEAVPAGPATPPGEVLFYGALPAQRLAAALALDAGDLPTARVWLEMHDRWLAWSGTIVGLAEGALGWAAYHRAAGDLTAAREHAARALAHATEPRQPLALLAAHRMLGELDAALDRPAEAAVHLEQALALAGACAAPYERALTLLALAELRGAAGERAEARALLDEVR